MTVACLKLAGSLQLIVEKMPADWWTWMSLTVEMIVGRIVVVGQIFALIVVVRLVVVAQPSAIAVAVMNCSCCGLLLLLLLMSLLLLLLLLLQ